MDDLIKKNNIPNINPSKVNQINETRPIVKEAIGNFFETFSKADVGFSWKDDLESQLAHTKRQSLKLSHLLDANSNGKNLNVIG
jgi:hypothetical protein